MVRLSQTVDGVTLSSRVTERVAPNAYRGQLAVTTITGGRGREETSSRDAGSRGVATTMRGVLTPNGASVPELPRT